MSVQDIGKHITLTKIDIQEVELAVERVLHRNGLVNGLPLTADERQQQAIRAVLGAGDSAVKVLLAKGAGATATTLNDVLEQLKKEFRL